MVDQIPESNTDTLDPAGNEFLEMAAAVIADSEKGTDDKPLFGEEKPTPDKTKGDEDASSASTDKGDKEDVSEKETDVPKLQASVKGLKKELGRIRDKNRTGADEAGELREQIAKLEGRIDEQSKGNKAEDASAKYTVDQLIEMQTDWEDVLADARGTLQSAKGSDDHQMAQQAEERLSKAKGQISAIRKEVRRRDRAEAEQRASEDATAGVALEKGTSLMKEFTDAHPDILEQGTDHWNAAAKLWSENKEVLQPLGAIGELVAGLLTAPKGDKAAKTVRKELLKDLDSTATKTLLKGTPSGGVKGDIDFESLLHKPGGFQKFQEIRDKIVSGG